jgi:hypothetical protein
MAVPVVRGSMHPADLTVAILTRPDMDARICNGPAGSSIDALTLVEDAVDAWKLVCADGRDHAELEISQSAFTPTTVRAVLRCDTVTFYGRQDTQLAVRCGVPLHQPNISGITPRVNPTLWLKHNHPSRKEYEAKTWAPWKSTWFYPDPSVLLHCQPG